MYGPFLDMRIQNVLEGGADACEIFGNHAHTQQYDLAASQNIQQSLMRSTLNRQEYLCMVGTEIIPDILQC